MRAKWIFCLLALWTVAIAAVLYLQPAWLTSAGGMRLAAIAAAAAAVPGVLLYNMYMSLLRPISAVTGGMELVRAQDFNSRLVKVGQHDADRLVGMFNRIIDRLKDERLHSIEQEHFLQLLINTSPVGIAIFDFDGRITLANPSMRRYLGIKNEDDIVGRTLEDMAGDIAPAISATPMRSSRTVRLSNTNVVRISRLDFMEKGFSRPYVLVESLTDEVMKAEKEAYGKVIRLIAHEVNNTIAGVNSMLETLGSILVEDDLVEAIESCRERCGSMSGFITAYADVVKIPNARLEKVDLNKRISILVPFLDGLAGNYADIRVETSDKEAFAMADPVLLEQVLVNIVKNSKESIELTGRRGCITVKVSSSPTSVTVSDNGAGIDESADGNLFTPFFSTKKGGQGLGLMMVGDILRQHGCRFDLRTDSGNGLTVFEIVFPPVNQAFTSTEASAMLSSTSSSDALG